MDVKELNGIRVLTFKDIDMFHERPLGTSKRGFYKNKKYFIENEDYFLLKPEDFQQYTSHTSEIKFDVPNNRGTTYLTQTGYLMLAKTLRDKKAWKVQRLLVNTYFQAKELAVLKPVMKEITAQNTYLQYKLDEQLCEQKTMNIQLKDLQFHVSRMENMFSLMLPPTRKSAWKSDMYNRLKKLEKNIGVESKIILNNIYNKLYSDYEINLNTLKLEYLNANPSLNNVPTVDIVANYPDVQAVFDSLLDNYVALYP